MSPISSDARWFAQICGEQLIVSVTLPAGVVCGRDGDARRDGERHLVGGAHEPLARALDAEHDVIDARRPFRGMNGNIDGGDSCLCSRRSLARISDAASLPWVKLMFSCAPSKL